MAHVETPREPDPPGQGPTRSPGPGPALKAMHVTPWVPWALAATGLAVLVAGAVAIVVKGDGGDALGLVIGGAVLMIMPLIVDRLEKLSVGAGGVDIHLTKQIVDLGAPKAADILERSGLANFASSYAFVHEELAAEEYHDAKVHLQDRLVEKAAELARRQKFDAEEVRRLTTSGPPMVRVVALGLMVGDPSLADSATVYSAISRSLSGNEQYHGMRLAELLWRQLSTAERQGVIALVDADHFIREDEGDRAALALRLKQLPLA